MHTKLVSLRLLARDFRNGVRVTGVVRETAGRSTQERLGGSIQPAELSRDHGMALTHTHIHTHTYRGSVNERVYA